MKRTNGYLLAAENKISWSEVKEGNRVILRVGLFNAIEFENFSWQLLKNFSNNNPDLVLGRVKKLISKKRLMKIYTPVSSIDVSAYNLCEEKEGGIKVYYLYVTKLNSMHVDNKDMTKIITDGLRKIYSKRIP